MNYFKLTIALLAGASLASAAAKGDTRALEFLEEVQHRPLYGLDLGLDELRAMKQAMLEMQALLMGNAGFTGSRAEHKDVTDMRTLLGRAVAAGNAAGLQMLLDTEYARRRPGWGLAELGLLNGVRYGELPR